MINNSSPKEEQVSHPYFQSFTELWDKGWAAKMGPAPLAVYQALRKFANYKTGTCFPCHATLMAQTGVKSINTLRKYLKHLESIGVIEVVKKATPNSSAEYRIITAPHLPDLTGEYGQKRGSEIDTHEDQILTTRIKNCYPRGSESDPRRGSNFDSEDQILTSRGSNLDTREDQILTSRGSNFDDEDQKLIPRGSENDPREDQKLIPNKKKVTRRIELEEIAAAREKEKKEMQRPAESDQNLFESQEEKQKFLVWLRDKLIERGVRESSLAPITAAAINRLSGKGEPSSYDLTDLAQFREINERQKRRQARLDFREKQFEKILELVKVSWREGKDYAMERNIWPDFKEWPKFREWYAANKGSLNPAPKKIPMPPIKTMPSSPWYK